MAERDFTYPVAVRDDELVAETLFAGSTGGLAVPSGTTAQRPEGASDGTIRFNETTQKMEYLLGGEWTDLSKSAAAFYDNEYAAAIVAQSKPASFLAGVNLSGAEFDTGTLPGTYGTNWAYPADADIDWFVDKGLADIIRLPFRWERLQLTLGGDLDSSELARLEAKAGRILDAGKKVILDPHNYAQYQYKPHNTTGVISNVTQANPAVVTYVSGDFEEGDKITFAGVGGMTQLNGNSYGVKNLNKTTKTFELFLFDGYYSNVNSTGYGAYTSGGTTTHPQASYYIGTPRVSTANYVDFLTKLGNVELFKNNPDVVICLTNEPNPPAAIGTLTLGPTGWFTVAQAAVTGLRQAGIYNRLQVPYTGYTGAHAFFAEQAHLLYPSLDDPVDNWLFDVHQYLDSDNSGTTTGVVNHTIGAQRVQATIEWCRQNGYKLFFGEVNAGNYNSAATSAEVKALVKFYDYLLANSDVVEGIAFWAGGERWGATYQFQLQPANLNTDPVPERTAALIARKKRKSVVHAAASIELDFVNNQAFGVSDFKEVLSTVQAGRTLNPWRDGSWAIIEPNTLRRTDRGLLTEVTKTNYLASHDFIPYEFYDASGEQGVAAAPDGSLNANRMLDNATNSFHIASFAFELSGISNGDTVCFSTFVKYEAGPAEYVWIKQSKPDTRAAMHLKSPQDIYTPNYFQSLGWIRPWITLTHSGGVESPLVGFQPDSSPSAGHIPDSYAGGTGKLLFWHKQMEKGLFPSSPIPLYTKSSSATRATDVVSAIGKFLALLQGTNFTVVFTVARAPEVAVDLPLITFNTGGTPVIGLYRTDDYKIASNIGSTQETAVPGAGAAAYRQSFQVGLSVRNTGTERVVVGFEGGTSVGQNVTVPSITDAQIGPFEGFIEKIRVIPAFYDTTALDALLLQQ